VRPEHALEAIAAARPDEAGEGAVGAGTGTSCFGYKAGIGGASRRTEAHVLGCLVCSNYGARRDLHLLVGPVAAESAPEPAGSGGSIVIVLGTDAPLTHRQLRRLAARATFGLGRAGSVGANASGEYALAFSTAQRVAHRRQGDQLTLRALADDSGAMRDLFEAAAEVVHEAVLNSLCSADAMDGRDGHRMEALPYELLEGAPGLRRLG
jgi:D-aminopeptidase